MVVTSHRGFSTDLIKKQKYIPENNCFCLKKYKAIFYTR